MAVGEQVDRSCSWILLTIDLFSTRARSCRRPCFSSHGPCSPAVAFRCGEQFTRALDCMPIDADLWAERTILALMGMQGPWIKLILSLWGLGYIMGGNESHKQHHDQETRQKLVTFGVLDDCMDHTDWRDIFFNGARR